MTLEPLHLTDPATGEAWAAVPVGWDEVRPLAKASPIPAGATWRTMHPNGPGTKGQPILVMPVQGHKHGFRVIGGAGGKLNGLRLHITKNPDDYKNEARQRAQEARGEEKQRMAAMSPEERAKAKEQKQQGKQARSEAESRFADTVLGPDAEAGKLIGEEGEEPENPKAQAQRHRERLAAAHAAVKEAQRKLLLDVEARTQAGIATTGGLTDHGLDVDDIVSEAGPQGPGYRRELAQRAEAAGLTADKLAEAVSDIRERRDAAKGRKLPMAAPEPGEEEGEAPPEPGEKPAPAPGEGAPEPPGLTEQAANIEAHKAAKELQAHKAVALREAVKGALSRNERLATLLKARQELRQAYREAEPRETIFKAGFQMAGEPDETGEQIEQSLYEQMLTNHVVGFLQEVGEVNPAGDAMNPDGPEILEGIHAARGAGAWDALHEFALAAVGQGMLERDTIEALGPEASAKLVSRGIRRDFSHEDQRAILDAVEEHHLKDQEQLPEVMAEAESLRSQANQIQADLAENPRDLSLAVELQKNRLEALKEGRRVLGGALGRLEARAALVAALRSPDQQTLAVPLGAMSPEKAVQTAAALGLRDGDYKIDHEHGEALLHITGQGQDRLVQPIDTAALHERDLALSIKGGQLDENGYLPAGFADRSDSRYDHPMQEAPQFRTQLTLEPGMDETRLMAAIHDHVGSRVADGERPQDILDDLWNGETLAKSVPEEVLPAYAAALRSAFPLTRQKVGKDGQPAFHTATGPDGQEVRVPVTEAVPFSDLDGHFQSMSQDYLHRAGHPGDLALASQRVDPDHQDFGEAIHRTLADDPRLAAAFTPAAELGSEDQGRMRDWFYREIKGMDPDAERAKAQEARAAAPKAPKSDGGAAPAQGGAAINPESRSTVEDALAAEGIVGVKDEDWHKALPAAGPEPERFEMDMFGEQSESPIWQDWKARAVASLTAVKQGRADDLETNSSSYNGQTGADQALAQAPAPSAWAEFVGAMGGLKQAQEAVQAHMKGRFAEAFHGHFQKVSGRGLKMGKTQIDHQDRFNAATLSPEQLKGIRSEQAKVVTGLRARNARGHFEEGSVIDKVDEARQRLQAARAGQAALFEKEEEPGLRMSLGQTLEAQVRAHLPGYAASFEGLRRGTGVHERVRMDGDKVIQQRAIKAITHLKRMGIFLGAGCVYGGTELKCEKRGITRSFYDWWISGEAPTVQTVRDDGNIGIVEASPVFLKAVDKMVKVTCANGAEAIVTPGHRFMGPNGWVFAGNLKKGMKLVCEGDPAPVKLDPTLDEITRTIHRVFGLSTKWIYEHAHAPLRSISSAEYHLERPIELPSWLVPLLSVHRSTDEPQSHIDQAFERGLRESIAERILKVHIEDDLHCTRKVEGSMGSCLNDPHPSDAPPPSLSASGPVSPPSQGDALEHSLHNSHSDDRGDGEGHTPICPQPARRAMTHSWTRDSHSEVERKCQVGEGGLEPLPVRLRIEGQSHAVIGDAPNKGIASLPRSIQIPEGAPWTTILSIEEVGQQLVFDISVPETHNYLAQGLVHHNSGKTPIMLGALTQIQKEGKLKKAILAVPSIVQAQFGAEGIRFLDPKGGFKMHAHPGESYEERMAAYQDPGKHAVVVTHQALRDDTMKILGEHLGHADEDATRAHVLGTPKAQLAEEVKAAFQAKGIDFNALMVDEAHGALDREGKEDSAFSRILNAHSRNMDYMVMATGDPMKNDVSEIYSDLHHLDPHQHTEEGRDEFMRRFGGDAALAKRSLSQQLSRYWFNGRVQLPTQAHRLEANIPLSAGQKERVDQVELAAGKLRTKDADTTRWARMLAPEAFEGRPEEEHPKIAQEVAKGVGTYRETAMNRVINLDPAGGKMERHIALCQDAVAEGKPVVIFAHNLKAVEAIHRNLEAAGIRTTSLTGKDSSKSKGEKLAAYQRGDHDVIVMSDAGSTGANLQRGKVMIHHDQGMTAMTMQQRDARINRIGQTQDVEIHHLLADHPWERGNAARVKRKGMLGALFQSPEDYLDDTGIAGSLRALRVRRNQMRAA